MIAPTIERLASMNLIQTYFRLAEVTPGARIWNEKGCKICTGAFEHPICNFAADLQLTSDSANRLLEIATNRPSFNVYVLPGDEPSNVGDILHDVGFRVGHSLIQMAAEPVYAHTEVHLTEAVAPNDRARVARFMVDQFFSRQAADFRRRVAETTCAAAGLPLYTLEDKRQIIGAVMLSEEGSSIGIYNLCVASGFRGRGWGKELVQAILNLAGERHRTVVLQCEASIQHWYTNLRFSQMGAVRIHNLPKVPDVDIIEQS